MDHGVEELECDNTNNCKIVYYQGYTPRMHYISPPTIYYESWTQLWFDPKNTFYLIEDLQDDEMHFINAKIGGILLDFEETVASDDSYQGYGGIAQMQVYGQVGEIEAGINPEVSMLWEVGDTHTGSALMTHCTYDNITCFQTRTVPVIFETSSNTTYTTGGQNMTVTGYGFEGNVTATIDGQDCVVTQNSKYGFSCEVQAHSTPSTSNVSQQGSNGITREMYNLTEILGSEGYFSTQWQNIGQEDYPLYQRKLELSTEKQYNEGNQVDILNQANKYRGWFIAPATTNYRFYMACDDRCSLYIGDTPDQIDTKTLLIDDLSMAWWSRRYYHAQDKQISAWVALTEGEAYYIEGLHYDYNGNNHFTVGVEIEQTDMVGHHHAQREVQLLTVVPDTTFESIRMTITNMDTGYFKLVLLSADDGNYRTTGDCYGKATAGNIKTCIQKYYRWTCGGGNPSVNGTYYDADGLEIDSPVEGGSAEFYITGAKLRSTKCMTSITVVKTSTAATIAIDNAQDVQLSSQPLGGNFKFKCVDPEGYESETSDINYWRGAWVAGYYIQHHCDGLYDKVKVYDVSGATYGDSNNGKAFIIDYQGLNADPGQMEIVSSETTPLTGDNLVYNFTTTTAYSTNIFYEVIPFEMLKTYESEPQLIVTVNGNPAVCHNMTCDVAYIEPTAAISDFTYTSSSKELSIVGTDLPTTLDGMQDIIFAQTYCTIDESSMTATGMTCTLEQEPVCGSHYPIVHATLGYIPTSGLTAESVVCTITAVTPSQALNVLGGDNLTFTGTYLPRDFSVSPVTIIFDDSSSTNCTPVSSTQTTLICLTSAFAESLTSTTVTPTITINGVAVSHSVSLTTTDTLYSVTSITPSSASPVLKTDIVIQLDTSFPYTLDRDDFTVNATDENDSTYVRFLKVNSVDDSAKTLTVKFGGAESSNFILSVRHSTYGLLKAYERILDVGGYVTGISPVSGSMYGGTLITISGRNFGDVYTDNPVQISLSGGIGNINCYVETTMATEITCRIDSDTTNVTAGQSGDVVVFLKTSEEATCEGTCEFQFLDTVPTVTGASTVFDTTNGVWTVVVDGTDFSGDTSTTSLALDGVDQTTTSVSSTQAVFTIINTTSSTLSGVKVLFDEGKPIGHELISDLTIYATLFSISPSIASEYGGVWTFNVPGLTQDQLEHLSITRPDKSHVECYTLDIPEYGILTCYDNRWTFTDREWSLSNSTDSTKLQCATTADCTVSTGTDFPYLTTTSQTDENTLVLTGTGFDISGFTASAEFGGVIADSVTIDSATQATATFSWGVPIGTGSPRITFDSDSDTYLQYWSDGESEFTNALAATDSTSGLTCSFAGGCTYTVTAQSLATMIRDDDSINQVTVCGQNCDLVEADSSSSTTTCTLPRLSTIYSNENFAIATESEDLDSGYYFGTSVDNTTAFDGDLLQTPEDSNDVCILGMGFKENHVGMISQVKYFMPDMDVDDKAVMVGRTQFQGSMNEKTGYNTIFTVDENLHAGWNYARWEDPEDYPTYRFYRFYSTAEGGCTINEITFTGVETVQNEDSTYTCEVKAIVGDEEVTLNSIEYQGALTTNLQSITPRYGPVTGGTSITFAGENFPTDTSLYIITLDGIDCPVSAATSTSVTCTTGDRPGLIPTDTQIYITGQGLVSNNGLFYSYVSFWSDDTTWGGEFAPMEGESIWIPEGLNLLVDIDRSPELNAIICEGALLFVPDADATHERFFDARYIFVSGGRMEVGTEEFPYTSKITITMHGAIDDPYLPIYGNKVIGVRFGTLDMHGVERSPVWTFLDQTAESNTNTLTLAEEVDWQVGEMIGVAPTGFKVDEAETRLITAVSSDRKTITLDMPLSHKHFAEIQWFDDNFIDTRAEIGLLSRNVVYRGDPETSGPNEYGATIFLHSEGDDSLTCRLSYAEFSDVGQAFKLGRYAIHFHMIGAVHNSYATGNAIHHSNNRAFTMHGTHYLRLINNVVYEGKGHIFFIEDAIETNNYLADNLVMKVKRSWSLLNTDQSPAGFWLTHPNNILLGNHVGGSDRYGFWYDLQEHAMGPSANLDVCPENERVGEFANNAAHTMGRYGLRIFHTMEPRTYPCQPMVYDESNSDDPYWQNPPIEANFWNYTGWKCNRDGAIGKKLGWVKFNNFKTADNREMGIQMSQTFLIGNYSGVFGNNLVIGQSNNTEQALLRSNPTGVVGPRTENWVANGIKFYNFNWGEAACFGSCSHCWHPQTSDHGARQYDVSNMYFDDATVLRRIRYGTPFNGIYHDLDGTLTGLGAGSWATHFEAAHNLPECQMDMTLWDGHICDSTVQVKGIIFYGETPQDLVGSGMKWLPYDDDVINAMTETELEEYIDNRDNYGTLEWKIEGWGVPMVTGHKYKIHWGLLGTNFDGMDVMIPQHYGEDDGDIYLVHNFTENRESLFVTKDGVLKANDTIPDVASRYVSGQNVVYPYEGTPSNEFHLIINGKGKASPMSEVHINLEAVGSCGSDCLEALDVLPMEDFFRFWSDADNWDNGVLPLAGSTVEIKAHWNMVLDLAETPIIEVLKVHGRLTFSDDQDVHLRVKHVSIRGGEFNIGSAFGAYEHAAKITLHGTKEENGQQYADCWMPGSKMIANAGTLNFYGQKREDSRMSRLTVEAFQGDTEIYVETLLDWVAGDRIALAPTSFKYEASEDKFIQAYDRETGKVTLTEGLDWHHWGQAESTGPDFNGVDMRAEVLLLTRNIQIVGENVESWGGRVITGDAMEFADGEIVFRYGSTNMDNVEIYNCSQQDSYDAALGWEASTGAPSSVTNSAIHNGLGWAVSIQSSKNVVFTNNVMYRFRPIGLAVDYSQDIEINYNVLVDVVERDTIEANWSYVDRKGGYAICAVYASMASCSNITVNYNIAAGITMAGFWAMAQDCDEDNDSFYGNVAHSIAGTDGGGNGVIYSSTGSAQQTGTCYSGSYFSAYKCAKLGALSHDGRSTRVDFHHMTMMDNGEGFGMVCGVLDEQEGVLYETHFYDNKVYGELSQITDCPVDGSYCVPLQKNGIMLNGCSMSNRGPMCTQGSCYPWHNLHGGGVGNQISILERNEFKNFGAASALGLGQYAISLSQFQSDYHPVHEFFDTVFNNVSSPSMAWMATPPDAWANMADCGAFPCTAPLNALLRFEGTTFEGENIPDYAADSFQVIADNDGFAPYVANCTRYEEFNGYACNNDDLGMLIFESEDSDKWDRSVQPIYVSKEGTEMASKLNSYMDHMWDGFYTGQVRLSRFPAVIEATAGSVYDLTMTGTPPKKMKFVLQHGTGATIRIAYPGAESRGIYKDGVEIAYNAWDDAIAGYGPVTQAFCGENRFIGIQNILEFYLTAGCELHVAPRNAIQTKVRMEWTLEEFFSGGGTTTFVDRITASLGIHASEVKVVSVYEGSLVVNYEVAVPDDDPAALAELNDKQNEVLNSPDLDLGAPVLEVETAMVVNDEKAFTGGLEKVYVIEVDTSESDKAWLDSMITWEYEPIVVVPSDDESDYVPDVEDDYVEEEYIPDYTQDLADRDALYESEQITLEIANEAIGYPTQDYVPGALENPDYEATNVAAQNSFDGAAVVAEENTIYQGVTVQVEKEPETVYKYTTEETVVVVEGEKSPEIITIEAEKDSKALLIPIALSIVLVVAVAVCIRQMLTKSKQQEIQEAEQRAMRIRNLNDQELSDCKANVVDLGAAMKQNDYDAVGRDSKCQSLDFSIKVGHEEYAQQYDPSNDFAVFGVGDPTRGGVQSMKEKMNLADVVDEVADESDEASPLSQNGANANSQTKLPALSDSKQAALPSFVVNANDLPEDKEIQSEGDEE